MAHPYTYIYMHACIHTYMSSVIWDITQVALLAVCFHAGFFLGLFFDPEDGGDMFLLNVGRLSTDYTPCIRR
jgi:hypothetical protein